MGAPQSFVHTVNADCICRIEISRSTARHWCVFRATKSLVAFTVLLAAIRKPLAAITVSLAAITKSFAGITQSTAVTDDAFFFRVRASRIVRDAPAQRAT